MQYDHFIQLGKILNDKIIDPHIRDGNFHYILIPKSENSPIRIDDRLYHVVYPSRLVDDYGDITVPIDTYIDTLLKDDNLNAYGIIKYTDKGVYIFGVSNYWFFEIKNGNCSYISLNVFTARLKEVRLTNNSLYSPTHYKDIEIPEEGNKGKALLSRYGSSDVVISPGEVVNVDLETKGYSVGFSNMTSYSEYKGELKYKVRFNIPSTVPEKGNPTIIATFKNHDDDRDEVNCNLVINSENAFNGLYKDMIDIDFVISTNPGTTITVDPYRVTVTH